MKKYIVYGIVAMLALVAATLLWMSRDNAPSLASQDAAPVTPAADLALQGAKNGLNFKTGLEGLPNSLKGTEVDGEFEVDANGHLKITRGIRNVFDYFLSTVGEEPVETIVARIRAYIHYKLKDPAAHEAEVILDGYIAYKKGLANIQPTQPPQQNANSIDVDAIRRQMDQVAALRSQYLAPDVIQAFFGDEDAYDRYTLARIQLMQNKALTDAQRAQQLAALEQQLPASVQESMKTVNQFQNLQAMTDDCKKRNCSAAELRQVRESIVGPEAADRLEQLDRDNAAWDQRMSSWLSQRAAILANTSLSSQDQQQQITDARNGLFNQQEQVRVLALERIHDDSASTSSNAAGGQTPPAPAPVQ